MNTCAHCGLDNAAGNSSCQQCGRPLEPTAPPAPVPHDESTVRWAGQSITPGLATSGAIRRSIPLDLLFHTRTQLIIGRASDCDLCLPHPSISRRHAVLERLPEGLRLRDLDSVNGVFVAGQRIREPVWVQERERVGIGPFLFSLANGVLHAVDSSQSLRLEARALEKVVSLGRGQTRKLLENINLVVDPGEFVSLLGPSGSGKTTLMDCLNGRRWATGGRVLANGEDFYRHFDSFRQSLGYVPQRDIVHTQLTVHRALYYTAQLRLPTDTEPAELWARIEEVLQQMELGPHRNTLVANLSGGQIKRVSLGAELLAQPCLLYIDEATSGLDAGTEARMMRLFRQLADEGKTVLCITHNVDNVDRCNLILLLARGKLVYYGPPAEALAYFHVGRLSEIYDRLAEREPATWEEEFGRSALHQEFVAKRLATQPAEGSGFLSAPPAAAPGVAEPPPPSSAPAETPSVPAVPQRSPLVHQFRVLTSRYVELLWGDRRSLRLLLLQSPIVALFILLGFVNKPYQQKVLAPRELTEQERRYLTAYRGLLRSAGNETLQPEEQEALTKVRITPKGSDTPIKGEDAAQLLHWLQQRPETATLPRHLEHVQFKVEGEPKPITATQLSDGLRQQESELLTKVLNAKGPVVPDQEIVDPRYTYMLLFIVAVTILWFGCNNAAKEIVKEEAIYGRERAVNLAILPYVGSKFLVLSVLSAIQTLLLMLVVFGGMEALHVVWGLEVPDPHYCLNYLAQFGVLALLSMTGVALGLLLSACVSTPDRANALLPYVLIPQIILGGGIMPVKTGALHAIAMVLSPVYWAFRATRRGATTLPAALPWRMEYDDRIWICCVVLLVEMVVLLFLTAFFLKRKDIRRA